MAKEQIEHGDSEPPSAVLNAEKLRLVSSWYDTENRPEDVPAGGVFDAWTIRTLDPSGWNQLSKKDKSLYYCAYGVLAPSTHNTSPQKFHIREDGTIVIYADRKAILPGSDPEGRQACVSIGAVIETIVHASSAYGEHASVVIEPHHVDDVVPVDALAAEQLEEGVDLIKMATISFNEGEIGERDLGILECIKIRKTTRAEFDRTELDADVSHYLNNLREKLHSSEANPWLHVIEQRLPITGLAQFHQKAIQTAVGSIGFQRELGEWLVENSDVTNPRGMRGVEFGRDDDATANLIKGMRGELKQESFEIQAFARAEKESVESASGILMVTTKDQRVADWIAAGRIFQQLALYFTRRGLHSSMQAALSETGFTPIKLTNMAVKTTLLKAPKRHIQAIFRVGRVRNPQDAKRPHSSRPSLDLLLV